uniref:Putative RNA editing ligase n=1 Tax=Clytia hemisphaerica TaxID=252671 RepID=A0A069DMY3_9CNID
MTSSSVGAPCFEIALLRRATVAYAMIFIISEGSIPLLAPFALGTGNIVSANSGFFNLTIALPPPFLNFKFFICFATTPSTILLPLGSSG